MINKCIDVDYKPGQVGRYLRADKAWYGRFIPCKDMMRDTKKERKGGRGWILGYV